MSYGECPTSHAGATTSQVWAQNWEWYDPARSAATLPHALRLAKQYVRDHAQYAARLGKPLVLEEFGMSRDGNRHEAGTPTRTRDAFYASLCDEVLALAAADTPMAGLAFCLLYTSPSPRDGLLSRMPSSA